MTIRAIAFFWKNFAIVRTVITRIRPDTDIRSQNIRSVIFTSVTIHDFLFFWCKIVFFIHTITKRSQSMYSMLLFAFFFLFNPVFFSVLFLTLFTHILIAMTLYVIKFRYRFHLVACITFFYSPISLIRQYTIIVPVR